MSKQREDLVIFIQNDKFKMMEFIQNQWTYKDLLEMDAIY